ncbi:hypothetical protein P9133_29665 [Bacillus thuringiensis]|uniref:Uncharacterized protein n=2 Tax=Bacillus cereus group TaxID=86661 RepID=A0AB37E0W0_BACCE|nr:MULTISPECIES: hypothetical protein [Bacillus cereus group]AFQ19556.1 hypothetical protein BTG_31098 [Bacillus thuringiensis HD-771]MBM6770592.1 hypothetical protein [Bacillus cereus]MDA2549587.1 hypothetical protein [Bacillus cereus]MDA2554686.1 hypothetical protein [Bacillus cereus]MDZ4417024.1 hypothetical protein [Bacillus cereus]
MNLQEDIQSIKRYVVRLEEQGKTELEILKAIYKWGTQAVIAEVLNINIRRLKYLSKKYGLKKNDSSRITRRCTHCGEEQSLSNFDVVYEKGKLRNKRVCYACQRDYYRTKYMHRVIVENWEKEQIKREINIKEYELEVLKELLK